MTSSRTTFFLFSLLALLIGAFSAVGVSVWYVSPKLDAISASIANRLDHVSSTPPQVEVVRVEREPAAPVVPAVFLQGRRSPVLSLIRRAARTGEEDVVTPERTLGALTALTVDGWLVTSADIFSVIRLNEVYVVWEGRTYPITKAIRDVSTGLAYLKITAQNLPVVEFAYTPDISAGLPVWLETAPGSMSPHVIIDTRAQQFTGVVGSEKMVRRYRINTVATSNEAGSPVWNGRGQLVGVIDAGETSTQVIPAASISDSLSGVVANGEIRRQTLGINGLDTMFLIKTAQVSNKLPTGFIIRADRTRALSAIDLKGPSAKLLKEGDILQRIDQDVLDAGTDLAERLAEYRPGTSLSVYGERNNVAFQANLILGSVVTSEVLK